MESHIIRRDFDYIIIIGKLLLRHDKNVQHRPRPLITSIWTAGVVFDFK